MDAAFGQLKNEHCVKSVQIRSFSSTYFRVFGLNTEIYRVNLRIQSISVFSPHKGKYGPEKTPYLDTFHAVESKNKLFSARGAAQESANGTTINVSEARLIIKFRGRLIISLELHIKMYLNISIKMHKKAHLRMLYKVHFRLHLSSTCSCNFQCIRA